MTFRIRKATINDLPSIMDTEHLAIKESLPVETISMIMDNAKYAVVVCCVVLDDGQEEVLGHAMYQDVDGIHVISRLLVHPSCWQRGVGRSLVEYVVHDAHKHRNHVQFVCIPEQAMVGFQYFLQRLTFKVERQAGIVSLYTYTGE
jgi:N-acetylglutamate synthase-like GNAT family acetyltransferase